MCFQSDMIIRLLCLCETVQSRSCRRCSFCRLECLADQPPNALLTEFGSRHIETQIPPFFAFIAWFQWECTPLRKTQYHVFGSSVARGVPDCLKYQPQMRRGCSQSHPISLFIAQRSEAAVVAALNLVRTLFLAKSWADQKISRRHRRCKLWRCCGLPISPPTEGLNLVRHGA